MNVVGLSGCGERGQCAGGGGEEAEEERSNGATYLKHSKWPMLGQLTQTGNTPDHLLCCNDGHPLTCDYSALQNRWTRKSRQQDKETDGHKARRQVDQDMFK